MPKFGNKKNFNKYFGQVHYLVATEIHSHPSITDGVHRNENFVEIIPVFSTLSNFFKKK